MGAQQLLNPRPAVLVGTVVDDKPNFITVSWAGITSAEPPTMSVAVRNIRYSLKGIQQNLTFSVNIPSADLVKETDFCGTVSGSEYNKVNECGFEIFYGNLKDAPLIEQCPINIECEVLQIVAIGDHSLIIGKIIESYLTDDCFINGTPDIKKIDPLCFCSFTQNSMGYYKVGEFVAKTASIK
ncbi:MAG: NADPH-flavin oxidoreductase [Ignavibacteria bacterium RBG_13_36_8]|nr:MAG: NADPH-flavin oxidoreductase [Ignavibacteria bacterium RBG_13_36_8]